MHAVTLHTNASQVLSSYVTKLGCTFDTAQNGLEAVTIYQASSKRYDLVLMDISMPVMNGYEATKGIRKFERFSPSSRFAPTRIIALTGLGSEASRDEAFTSGVDEFRTKPVPMKDLKVLLDSLY